MTTKLPADLVAGDRLATYDLAGRRTSPAVVAATPYPAGGSSGRVLLVPMTGDRAVLVIDRLDVPVEVEA